MGGDWVIDASLLAAVGFRDEERSIRARAFVMEAGSLIAPDLIILEIANVAAKKVWREDASVEDAAAVITLARELTQELAASLSLADRAFELAARHRFSAYDATYLALAELRGLRLATLDFKLVHRAREHDLGGLVQAVE